MMWTGCLRICGLALSMIASAAFANQVVLSEDEIAQVLSHGPWPFEVHPDPSNRVSGNPDAIAFGETLFFSSSLSSDGMFSCATCHVPDLAFSDGIPRANGRKVGDRNTLGLNNLRFHRWFGWDGSTDNLWAQSIMPILNPNEMAMTSDMLAQSVRTSMFSGSYTKIFGEPGRQTDQDVLVNVAKALAAFQETIVTGKTPFDDFRDALARGDTQAAAAYPVDAQRGLVLFLGRGNCAFCHTGPLFTNGEFHDAGVPYFTADGGVDMGRHSGISTLMSSPFTLAGKFTDDPDKSGAWAVRGVRPLHSDFGTFRVPGLRNLVHSAPYMHDGSLATLTDVVTHYSQIDIERLHADGEAILEPLNLSDTEIADLVAFLETLSVK